MIQLLRTLRDAGGAVEVDLAGVGIDLRDHYAPGSGPSRLTARRLYGFVRAFARRPGTATYDALEELRTREAQAAAHDQVVYMRDRKAAWEARRQTGGTED